IKQTADFAEYAKSRRGPGKGQKWSREQVRDLVESMQGEFTSSEIKDALINAVLPPIESIQENKAKQVASLTPEDQLGRLDILPDLSVVISIKETSEWEPHVTFAPASDPKILHVIINGIHPYYQTLEAKDGIAECIQQYIYDAVAEFKTVKMMSRVNPDSVRRLKDQLLRARVDQILNDDAAVRDRAGRYSEAEAEAEADS